MRLCESWDGTHRQVFLVASNAQIQHAFHCSTGVLAALTASGRLKSVECGAVCRCCGPSAAIWSNTPANASRVSQLSVSVGSNVRAWTR